LLRYRYVERIIIEEFFERGPIIPHPASVYNKALVKGKVVPVLN
jgi:hypothetical protein